MKYLIEKIQLIVIYLILTRLSDIKKMFQIKEMADLSKLLQRNIYQM